MKKRLLMTLSLLSALALIGCKNASSDTRSSSDTSSKGNASTSDTSQSGNTSDTYKNTIDTYVEPEIEAFESQTDEDLSDYDITDISKLTKKLEITSGGTYVLSNENDDFQVEVNTSSDVVLILNGVSIKSTDGPAINVVKANSFTLKLSSHTKNYLEDSESNTLDGVLNVKKCNLDIQGDGYLIVKSNGLVTDEIESGIGIYCSKEIDIKKSHIQVTSCDHGISGKTGLKVEDAYLDITASLDGIHSKEGGLSLKNSILKNSSKGDGIDVTNEIEIDSSSLYITTEGEFLLYSASQDTDDSLYEDSRYIKDGNSYKKISKDDMNHYQTRYYFKTKCKGMKSDTGINIDDSTIDINSSDDAIASDGDIDIIHSKIDIHTLDQGLNSEQNVNIGSKETTTFDESFYIRIYSSFEGIQGAYINFYDGYTYIISDDDGVNATSDTLNDVSINIHQEAFLYVNAEGDGIDSNGYVTMDGGTAVIYGPSSGGNFSLDFDKTFALTGGNLFAFSNPDMIELPDNSQNLVSANTNDSFAQNEMITLKGDDLSYSFLLPKAYSRMSFIASTPELKTSSTYQVCKGGTPKGSFHNGVLLASETSGEETLYEFTISSLTTNLGNGNQQGPGFNPGGRPGRP